MSITKKAGDLQTQISGYQWGGGGALWGGEVGDSNYWV